MKMLKKITAFVMALALMVSMVPATTQAAVKNKTPKISATKKTIKVGQTIKLKIKKNGVKKIKATTWKVNKKAIVSLKSKNKTSVKIIAKKEGTVKVTAKVKYQKKGSKKLYSKKLTCKVNVEKISTSIKPTVIPAVKPTQIPVKPTITASPEITKQPTAEPTIEPTVKPTLDPLEEPIVTKISDKQGNEIGFTQRSDYLYVEQGEFSSIEDRIPDAENFKMEIVYKGKKCQDITVNNIDYYTSMSDNNEKYAVIYISLLWEGERYTKSYNVYLASEDINEISGSFTRFSEVWEQYIEFKNTESDITYETFSREDGSYKIWLPSGNYEVLVGNVKLGEVDVETETDVKYDIHADLCDVKVKIQTQNGYLVKNKWIGLYKNSEYLENPQTGEDGTYFRYLLEGEYSIYGDETVKEHYPFTVSRDKTEYVFTLPVCKISGKVYNFSELWADYSFKLKTDNYSTTVQSDSNGNYEAYVPAAEYSTELMYVNLDGEKFLSQTIQGETFTVNGDDEQKDIHFKYTLVTNEILQNVGFTSVTIYDSSKKIVSGIFSAYCKENSFKDYLLAGETYYFRDDKSGFRVGSLTIGENEETTNYTVDCRLYTISGKITGITSEHICIRNMYDEKRYITNEEGVYSVQVPKGTYEIVCDGDTEKVVGTVTVEDADLPEQNFSYK